MSELNYGGVAVTMSPAGLFTATVNGTKLEAPSYASLKKKIDKAGAFKPLQAIKRNYYKGTGIEKFEVVGVRKNPEHRTRSWAPKFLFVVSGRANRDTETEIVHDTPENRAVYAELFAEEKRNEEAANEAKKREAAIERRLTRTTADKLMIAQDAPKAEKADS